MLMQSRDPWSLSRVSLINNFSLRVQTLKFQFVNYNEVFSYWVADVLAQRQSTHLVT